MAKGFVGGFVERDGRWISQWIRVPPSTKKRRQLLEEARQELARQLAVYCGGEAVARRNMILVDGLCPRGRELLETFVEAARGQSST
jgi:hypothetical protein